VKSPLACLKSHSDEVTQVVTLDSWARESSEPNPFWAHFLIEAWAALEGERESLGLCEEAPTVQDLIGRIKFVHPIVRFTSSFTVLDCGIHSFFVGAVANELVRLRDTCHPQCLPCPPFLAGSTATAGTCLCLSSLPFKPRALNCCLYVAAVSDGSNLYRRFNFNAGFSC
jgi:hypothetical protein